MGSQQLLGEQATEAIDEKRSLSVDFPSRNISSEASEGSWTPGPAVAAEKASGGME